jgi:hypothetical protein
MDEEDEFTQEFKRARKEVEERKGIDDNKPVVIENEVTQMMQNISLIENCRATRKRLNQLKIF